MKKTKLTESELLGEIREDLDLCLPESSQVSEQRAMALKYYLGEKFGNEVEGRSQIVTTDVYDTIEGLLPPLLKMFTSSDDVALFDPVTADDEEQARQESDYVNYVFYKDNPGFQILYSWFKDALLSKNGVVKYWWEDQSEEKHETYEGLMMPQVQMLLADQNIEITGQEIIQDDPNQPPIVNVNITRKDKKGRLRIMVVPPEKFHISPEHNSIILDDVPFCAHETEKYKWELEDAGYDQDKVDDLFFEEEDSQEYNARFSDIESYNLGPDLKKVKIYECYKRVDWDNDGYPELRKITIGNDSVILDNVEIDYLPFESITPIPLTHRYVGLSYADITMDIQLVRSTLLRNIFDNLYLINNRRMGVVEGEVNLDDAMDSRPGGMVRMSAPGMIFPIEQGAFPGAAYEMMQYLDSMRENRTGVTRYNQGLDANSLNKTATGVNKIMEASQERVLLVAKLFGDGLKRLLLGIHRLLLQNQDQPKVVRLRGKWVDVNPSEWKERENMTINVGLGTNDKQIQMQMLQAIGQVQKEMMGAGLKHMVDDKKLYSTAKKLVEATGMKHVELFFNDPNLVPPPPPPPPPPEIEIQKMIAQAEMQKAKVMEADVQRKSQEDQMNHQIEMKKLEIEMLKLKLEAEKAAVKGVQDGNKQEFEKQKFQTKTAVDVAKVVGDAELKKQEGREQRKHEQRNKALDFAHQSMINSANQKYEKEQVNGDDS